jgi:hypothetical protein
MSKDINYLFILERINNDERIPLDRPGHTVSIIIYVKVY